ncbi:spondin domain-containing protein [Alistipes sp.]|uniref:spondin domain-containing protein n=1 Tax=Alistipes sp. TaxID=1872444 RepID=UPI003AEF958A
MKKKYFSAALAAALLFAGFAFTACDDDDDNGAPGTKPTIKFENVVAKKNYVQSGTFAAAAPGATSQFTFYAAKGQRLMLVSKYSNSNDLFFAPANPGIALFNDQGVPNTGIVANAVKLWDNGTRVNEQPGPGVSHPGTPQTGVVTEVNGTDAAGHTYPAASDMFQVSLAYDVAQSLFTCTITNISNNTANSTPFSGGVFVVSNILDGELVMDKPFFSVDQKSSTELTQLAENSNVSPLQTLVASQTGIITTLAGAIVVVYTGDTNPIYTLNQKDAQLGLAALAQRGDPSPLKTSLEKVPQVRKIYTITETAEPGESLSCTYDAATNEKVAFATMFGYSNDWFFANGPALAALTKGDVTSKTVLLDDGTAISQYPGAGNAQYIFGGTVMPEDKPITAVGSTFPVPAVNELIKVTIY